MSHCFFFIISVSSLQVEVMVSLVPPVATPEPQKVVLILSSLVPVNWVITATGVWGHIYVYVRAKSFFLVFDV